MSWLDELLVIRTNTNERIHGSDLVYGLLNGEPNMESYKRYLLDVRSYAVHSPVVIGLAGSRATQTNRGVGAYLLHHATEEVGHEDWAAADLRKLGMADEAILAHTPSLPCQSMIALEYYWANVTNPVSVMGWMFTLEALGDDMGHYIAAAVDNHQSGASVFVNQHGTADHDHIADIIGTLERHVENDRDRQDVLRAAQTASDLYVGIVRAAGMQQ
jgi:pyrroloquinoline quinone (PQQ) biosynthesis protein C